MEGVLKRLYMRESYTNKRAIYRNNWCIHETGEWFENLTEASLATGASKNQIRGSARKHSVWNGLHFYYVPRAQVCRGCGCKLTATNRALAVGYECKDCRKLRLSKNHNANPEIRKRIYQKQCLKKYGLTSEAYDKLLEAQGGVCAICGEAETLSQSYKGNPYGLKRLAVDHNHHNGKVRGLLCSRCNLVLGRVEENPDVLRKMISYIAQYGARS